MTEAAGLRTHYCGELRADHVGSEVSLCGWVARRRDHGGVAFIDLRDASGVSQVVINDEAVAHPLRSEFCLRVTGNVRPRPAGNENPNLPTGAIEVEATTVEVLNESAVLPFPIEEHHATTISDEVRYQYRYLDQLPRHAGDHTTHTLLVEKDLAVGIAHGIGSGEGCEAPQT